MFILAWFRRVWAACRRARGRPAQEPGADKDNRYPLW